jgi:hypothetical protein
MVSAGAEGSGTEVGSGADVRAAKEDNSGAGFATPHTTVSVLSNNPIVHKRKVLFFLLFLML